MFAGAFLIAELCEGSRSKEHAEVVRDGCVAVVGFLGETFPEVEVSECVEAECVELRGEECVFGLEVVFERFPLADATKPAAEKVVLLGVGS
jgi:hypothetical protein